MQVIYQRHFWGERPIYFHCLACSVTSWLELWSFLHPQSLRCYVAASHPFPDMSLMRTLQALSLLFPCRATHRALPLASYLAQSFRSFTESILPLRSCTTALTRWPQTMSGGPITATSAERAEDSSA